MDSKLDLAVEKLSAHQSLQYGKLGPHRSSLLSGGSPSHIPAR